MCKYTQDWTAYNQAQTQEKMLFLTLLDELALSVDNGPEKRVGRSGFSLHDKIFSMCVALYTGKSSRRSSSELEVTEKLSFVEKKPHFNTLLGFFRHEDMTPILHRLVSISSLPLKQIESDFTVDASGFSAGQFDRWVTHKYGHNGKKERRWVKMHAMSGVKTNVITSIEITKGNTADITCFETLVRKTGSVFDMREVSADKAYLSRKNLQVVDSLGALPLIPFKKNNRRRARKSGGTPNIWREMFDMFHERKEEFYQKYHKRSNSETVFSMLKQKFSDRVRTKHLPSQINELLCMAICHNICVLIQEIFELGIGVDFNLCAEDVLAQK